MKLRKAMLTSIAAIAAVSAFAVVASAESYNAYLVCQTTTYSFRNEHADATYGVDSNYYDHMIVWGDSATDPDTFGDDYSDCFDYDIAGYVVPSTFTDAVLDGDGTYTVKLEDFPWDLKADPSFNVLVVDTDIPLESGAKITEVKIIIDGNVVDTVADPMQDETKTVVQATLANIWNSDLVSYAGVMPTSTLELEFTITGLGAGEAAAEETADDAVVAEPIDTTTVVDTAAPTTDDKGNADTGVEGVAAIAGLAVVATAAAIVAKKRK